MLAFGSAALMGSPPPAAAQPATVPLGTAAQFGLLSGAQLTADATSRAFAFGEAGALGGQSGAIATDSSQYGPGGPPAPVIATALADLATARTWCSNLPGQQALTTLNGATPVAGTYTLTGNVTLPAGSRLTLSGDSSSRFVFNISGSLTVEAGAAVVLAGIRPGQVYWNVSGGVTVTGPAALAGVVLSAGAVTISGVVASDAAYLSAGAITLTAVSMDGDFTPAYFSAATVLARPKPNPPAPSAAPPCTSLVLNGSCEQEMPGPPGIPTRLGNVGSRMANRASEAAFWDNPNEESPDYFGSGGIRELSVPANAMNGYNPAATAPRSGTHYLGVYSMPAALSVAQASRREYVWQTLAAPLTASTTLNFIR